jgi:hypothetical protein
MEVLGDGPETEVSDADLQEWLDAHPDRYAVPARYDVRQVFFDPARRGARLAADLDAALRDLQRKPEAEPSAFGDATLLAAEFVDVTRADVAAHLGEELAAQLVDAPLGRWFGPVASGYGAHLLRVELREEPRVSTLAEVRDAVERDVRYARSEAASEALYERLLARYTVRIEAPVDGVVEAVAAESQ